MVMEFPSLIAAIVFAQTVLGQNPTYQCNNCQVSSTCKQQVLVGSFDFQTAKECDEHCLDTGNQCQMADYDMKLGTCKKYTCTQVQQAYGYKAFRRSSTPVCSPYTLARYEGFKGTDSCRLESTAVPRDLIECINYCLESANCTAVDYAGTKCTLHSCGEKVNMTQSIFVERICQQDKKYIQTCQNCNEGSTCSSFYASGSAMDCDKQCELEESCSLAVLGQSGCRLFGCSFLQSVPSMTAYRKSPIDDCLVFEIEATVSRIGTCSAIETRYNFPNQDYCFDICLDTPGCRAVTYAPFIDACALHECDNNEEKTIGALIFIRRICTDTSTELTTVTLPNTTPTTTSTQLTTMTRASTALTIPTTSTSTLTTATTSTRARTIETTAPPVHVITKDPSHSSLSSAVTTTMRASASPLIATSTSTVAETPIIQKSSKVSSEQSTTKNVATNIKPFKGALIKKPRRCSGVITAYASTATVYILILSSIHSAGHLSW